VARTVYYAAMSLDGYIADREEKLAWLMAYEPADGTGDSGGDSGGPMEEGGSYEEFYAGIGALVMGSKTYEFVLGHNWPYGDIPSWVFTSRELARIDGAGRLRFASGDVAEHHDEVVAAADGKDVWMVGGGELASQYLEAGLLDSVRVTVVPTVLGDGLPLFARPVPPLALRGTDSFGNGMVELTYEVVR
jgi:dihydrofolate reductase